MLTSLFGDLPPQRLPKAAAAVAPLPLAAGTPAAAHVPAAPAMDEPLVDVVVDNNPTDAIRAHFARQRAHLQQASAMLTLLDPSRLWASQVLHALAGAGGQPVQRLNVRERASLRTLAVIERTLVHRRGAATLRVYHADIRGGASAAGVAPEEITSALAEASQMTAVIAGAMQPHALATLLRGLLAACARPQWRCPLLVFVLPPGAAALHQRVLAQPWPPGVRALVLAEPLGSAAGVWNRLLETWDTARGGAAQAAGDAGLQPPAPAPAGVPASPGGLSSTPPALARAAPQPPAGPATPPAGVHPPASQLQRMLLPLARIDGVLACAIVDLDTGDLLASWQQDAPGADLPRLAAALCAARLAHQAVAPAAGAPDELLVTSGPQQTLLRRLPGTAPLGLVALLDRQRCKLAPLRFALLQAEPALA